ncbi:MAG TPA: gamma-glutamylcyclotransferase [Aggregatilineales bacterium]|nr:gamma-glutamylcyclotransferase [Aggregatilineales bacterium]
MQQPDPVPFFVYGTLRRGQPNYETYLAGATISERPARLMGAALYSVGHFPVLVEAGESSSVVGEWIVIHPTLHVQVRRRLDRLEGCEAGRETWLFRRVRRRVQLEGMGGGAESEAWLYLGDPAVLRLYPHVHLPDGDWLAWLKTR